MPNKKKKSKNKPSGVVTGVPLPGATMPPVGFDELKHALALFFGSAHEHRTDVSLPPPLVALIVRYVLVPPLVITRVAGLPVGVGGHVDGDARTAAKFMYPSGPVAYWPAPVFPTADGEASKRTNDCLLVTDRGNNKLRCIDLVTRRVTTIPTETNTTAKEGTGLSNPMGILLFPDGDVLYRGVVFESFRPLRTVHLLAGTSRVTDALGRDPIDAGLLTCDGAGMIFTDFHRSGAVPIRSQLSRFQFDTEALTPVAQLPGHMSALAWDVRSQRPADGNSDVRDRYVVVVGWELAAFRIDTKLVRSGRVPAGPAVVERVPLLRPPHWSVTVT